MGQQKLQVVSADSLYQHSLLQIAGYGNDELLKICSCEVFSFIYRNLREACGVEFTTVKLVYSGHAI